MGMEGLTEFTVYFVINGKEYHFYGNDIPRHTTDGCGNAIYGAKCYDKHEKFAGVANMTEDWRIRSFFGR